MLLAKKEEEAVYVLSELVTSKWTGSKTTPALLPLVPFDSDKFKKVISIAPHAR